MATTDSHQLSNATSMPDWLVVAASFLAMVLILLADVAAGASIRLHVLYVFPLAALGFYRPRSWVQLLAFGMSLAFQVLALTASELPRVALLTDVAVAAAASSLTLLLASTARTNYLQVLSQASTDGLTQLANRAALMSAIEAEVNRQRRYGGLFSLAELDLDGFKTLNDTRGHAVGDEVLQQLAEMLRRHTRKSDLAGRLGGDEFLILMPNMGEADCLRFLQHLCSTIETGMIEAGFEITASIGFKTFLKAPESISQALLQVDQSMYEAKKTGKGRVARRC